MLQRKDAAARISLVFEVVAPNQRVARFGYQQSHAIREGAIKTSYARARVDMLEITFIRFARPPPPPPPQTSMSRHRL
jgi:hypothetical protein